MIYKFFYFPFNSDFLEYLLFGKLKFFNIIRIIHYSYIISVNYNKIDKLRIIKKKFHNVGSW